MADPRAATESATSRHAALSAWYAPATVGLAVFLGGLLVSHPPITGYRVEATVSPSSPISASGPITDDSLLEVAIDPAAAEAWLKSDEILRKLAGQNPTAVDSGDLQASSLSGEQLAELRDHLQVETIPGGSRNQWTVRFVGRQRNQARAVVERAAHELAGYLDRQSDRRPRETEIAALRREVLLAEDEAARLEDELLQLRHEQLAATLVQERSQLAGESAARQADVKSPQANRRLVIAQKIDELRIEYRTLVATRLVSHPSVAAVVGQIEQLESQLGELRDPAALSPAESHEDELYLPNPAALQPRRVREATFTSHRSADAREVRAKGASELEEVRARLLEVTARRKDAEHRLDAAIKLASTVWQKQWIVSRCSSTKRIGGTPASNDLLWAGIFGLVAATTISIDWSVLTRRRVLATATQARNSLPAPLLGEIALSSARTMPRSVPGGAIKRRIVRLAEWMLIVSLFLLILAAVSQRELAAQLASDPFGAVTEAFDTVRCIGR